MPLFNIRLGKGQRVAFSSGDYSDYHIVASGTVLKGFLYSEVVDEFYAQRSEDASKYSIREDFIYFLKEQGYMEFPDIKELHWNDWYNVRGICDDGNLNAQ